MTAFRPSAVPDIVAVRAAVIRRETGWPVTVCVTASRRALGLAVEPVALLALVEAERGARRPSQAPTAAHDDFPAPATVGAPSVQPSVLLGADASPGARGGIPPAPAGNAEGWPSFTLTNGATMTKPLATIPADLRGRRDLSIPQIEEVIALRTTRKRWQTTLDGLPQRAVELKAEIAANVAEEMRVLGTPKS